MNVGVMGHVDSGKTSLVRALSTVLSTAALDKSPQSKERGITLDLGFSALMTALPSRLSAADHSFESLQMTFVDCPGHATLIRTIIAGAAIIDVVLLVIDVCKGIQTQTAECIVIAEISCRKLVVALNKIDLLPEDERENKLIKMKLRIEKLFSQTKFGGKVSIVAVAAAKAQLSGASEGVSALVDALRECAELPSLPSSPEPFCFAIDHFFAIKGGRLLHFKKVLHKLLF